MAEYEILDESTYRVVQGGAREKLSNFNAEITHEMRYSDGHKTETYLTLVAKAKDHDFDPITIPADKFASLNWVMSEWGVAAVILPGQSVKDALRTCIQLRSEPEITTIYTHTGWSEIKGKPHYLHAGGAINAKGNVKGIRVQLPPDLSRYHLDASKDPRKAVAASLDFVKMGNPKILWPMLAATFVPLHGPCDFAIHVSGRTGTFKSELASLIQSHYGAEMDARHLPGSWSSTSNALEAQAFKAKNAIFVVDDFIPVGTAWQVRSYQRTADQIIRGQGNQAGRARLTDVSQLQTTMYPRGLVFSTGEDTPEGQSVRGRMYIIELAPDDIKKAALSKVQANRHLLPQTTGHYVQHLAKYPGLLHHVSEKSAEYRDQHLEVGHSRTPSTIGRLLASLESWLEYLVSEKLVGRRKMRALRREAFEAILATASQQAQYLMAADPCEAFCESIRHIFAAHIGHVRTVNGGIPLAADQMGWTKDEEIGGVPTYRPHGKSIGWIDWDQNELLIDATAAYNDVRKHAGGAITFTKQTMLKRLKDSGLLTRVDETRQRNTVRVTCEQHTRNVIAMPATTVLQIKELPR